MFFRKDFFKKYSQGFTLIEVIVAVFIFLVIMMAVARIFVSSFQGYTSAKMVQRDLEAAQFSLNTIAKELRTSSVVSAAGSQTAVQFYDHSQGVCFRYRILGTDLQVARHDELASLTEEARQAACLGRSFINSDFATIVSNVNFGVFQVVLSDGVSSPKVAGKVTVSMRIGEGVVHQARIQTTVSLRDYGNIGL